MVKQSTCRVCGQQFEYEYDGEGRLRRFCDEHPKGHKGHSMSECHVCDRCGIEFSGPYNAKRCRQCHAEVVAERSREQRKRRAQAGIDLTVAVPEQKTCCRCGETQAASEFHRAKDRPDGLQSECRACRAERQREYRRKRSAQPTPKKQVICRCAVCGESFTAHRARRLCGKRECRLEVTRRTSRELSAAKKVLRARKCKECGKTFVPEYGNKRRGFDTEDCMKKYGSRVGKATRRARLRGAGKVECIDPLFILKRDGYRCYLCGTKTPKSLRGTILPNAPEIDHVVPIARGGTHTEANLRCVCRSCNIRKSDRLLDEIASDGVQLRLL